MTKQETISIMQFKKRFNNEASCREYLYNMRWSDGFICPKCGNRTCYVITIRNLYECTGCHYQAHYSRNRQDENTFTSGKMVLCIYFVGMDKRDCSAASWQRSWKYPIKAWYMLHRIRKAMKDRDAPYTLSGIVELDDTYFGPRSRAVNADVGQKKRK